MSDLTRSYVVDGWMRPIELIFLASQAAVHRDICEVGSWKGRSTRALADHTEGMIVAVDTWKGTPGDAGHENVDPEALYAEFARNMAGLPAGRVVPYRGTSLEAAATFASLGKTFDMVFIDADHHYESVRADIQAWRRMVRPGGLLCGHDYAREWPGVRRAVDECFAGVGEGAGVWVDRFDSIWAVTISTTVR